MNTIDPAPIPRFEGGWPEFLERLDRLYRCIGLEPDAARAATFADAEIFVPEARPEPEYAA